MKKIGTMGIVIILAIAMLIGGYWYITTSDADDWTEPWSDQSVFNGEWRTRIEVGFADGTHKSFEDVQNKDSLTVLYQNSEVTSVTWYLEALATTPVGNTPWDQCEIDIGQQGTLRLDTAITPDYANSDFFNMYDNTNVEIDVDTDPYYQTVCSHTVQLDTATENMDSGEHTLMFSPAGTMYYRGIGIYYPDVDPTDHGDWVEVSPPDGVSFSITVENTGITINFDSNVIWS